MGKKIRIGAMALTVPLVFSIMAGCSGNNSADSNSSASPAASATTGASTSTLEPYNLTMVVPIFGNIPKDVAKVQEAVNKITQSKINTKVTLEPINVGNYVQQLNLKYSSNEKLDVAFIFGQLFNGFAAQGRFTDVGELLKKNGQGIIDAVGPKYVSVPTINGKLYGVPGGPITGTGSGYFMRKDIVDKHNIDVSSIKTFDDIEKVLQLVKEKEPDLVPLASSSSFNPISAFVKYDSIGDYAALPFEGNDLKVENYFANPEYADRLNQVRKWFQAGYINKDAATTNSLPTDIVKAGKAFSYVSRTTATSNKDQSILTGHEMVTVNLTPTYVTTGQVLTGVWTVAQQSKDPSRAMMFLNLLYTDKDLVNLLIWGTEGDDYVKVTDNVVDFPQGKTAETVGYNLQGISWIMGNQRLLYLSKQEDPKKWEISQKWADSQIESRALGFTFNSEPVKNDQVAIKNVVTQYQAMLETGSVDPVKELPNYLNKLKAAGIDKYIAEVQKQLTEWAATSKK